jgi:hypothetical protein
MALNQGSAYAYLTYPLKLMIPGGGSHVAYGRSSNSRAQRRGISHMRMPCESMAGLPLERFLQLLEEVEHLERDRLFQPRGKHRAAPPFSDPCP